MDQSKALHQLTEAADLISMLEALTNSVAMESQASAPWGGLKITLRNVRQMILASHDTLAADLVARARARFESQPQVSSAPQASTQSAAPARATENASENVSVTSGPQLPARSTTVIENANIKLQRKDLRAQLERFVER